MRKPRGAERGNDKKLEESTRRTINKSKMGSATGEVGLGRTSQRTGEEEGRSSKVRLRRVSVDCWGVHNRGQIGGRGVRGVCK